MDIQADMTQKIVVWASLGVLAGPAACTTDSKEIGATVGEASSTASTDSENVSTGDEPGTQTQSGTGMVETSGSSTDGTGSTTMDSGGGVTGTMDTGTGEVPMDCEQAFTEPVCESVGEGEGNDLSCGWFDVSTWVLGAEGTCSEVVDKAVPPAYCFGVSQGEETCGSAPVESTCPDGETVVYYYPLGLEIGAVQIFAENDNNMETCDGPGGSFEPCVFDGSTYDPPECECGCPR